MPELHSENDLQGSRSGGNDEGLNYFPQLASNYQLEAAAVKAFCPEGSKGTGYFGGFGFAIGETYEERLLIMR